MRLFRSDRRLRSQTQGIDRSCRVPLNDRLRCKTRPQRRATSCTGRRAETLTLSSSSLAAATPQTLHIGGQMQSEAQNHTRRVRFQPHDDDASARPSIPALLAYREWLSQACIGVGWTLLCWEWTLILVHGTPPGATTRCTDYELHGQDSKN